MGTFIRFVGNDIVDHPHEVLIDHFIVIVLSDFKQKMIVLVNSQFIIRNILSLAEAHGVHTLVLGAFGCGAFMNPPEVVAQAFAWQLMNGDFRNTFREVVFAIKADDQRGYYNYQVFSNYLYGMPENGGRPEKWKGHVSNDKVPGVSSLILMIMILCIVLAVGFGVLFGVGLYLNWFSNALVAVLMGVLPGVFIGMAILFTWQFLKN